MGGEIFRRANESKPAAFSFSSEGEREVLVKVLPGLWLAVREDADCVDPVRWRVVAVLSGRAPAPLVPFEYPLCGCGGGGPSS
jgi:hypothetical protein